MASKEVSMPNCACEDRMDALKMVVDYYMVVVDLIHIIVFSRFIYVLASKKALDTVEYTVRVQVLNSTIAHNLVYIIGIALSHKHVGSILRLSEYSFVIYKERFMVMQFTSAKMYNALFGFLMALTRFTAVKFPLRQNEIWTKKRLIICICCVWFLAIAFAIFATLTQNPFKMMDYVDIVSPIFIVPSVIIYISIIVLVRKTLKLMDQPNKSFYRCLSRITIAAFTICISDLTSPLFAVLYRHLEKTNKEEYNQTIFIFWLLSYNFSFFITNSLTVWVFILFVPRFRFLFFGSFCQQTPSNRPSLSTERQRV